MFVYTYGMTLYANIKGDYAFYKYKRDKKWKINIYFIQDFLQ
jgi:hypothetical protein